jgi:exoribonuclease-2
MRPRTLSTKPGLHAGLGLDIYTQVTSPLRRYTDLLAHQQIRAFILGKPLLDDAAILARAQEGDRGLFASVKAEKASRRHWTCVYIMERKKTAGGDLLFDAVTLENRGAKGVFSIPELGMETTCALPRKNGPWQELNGEFKLKAGAVKLTELDVRFYIN